MPNGESKLNRRFRMNVPSERMKNWSWVTPHGHLLKWGKDLETGGIQSSPLNIQAIQIILTGVQKVKFGVLKHALRWKSSSQIQVCSPKHTTPADTCTTIIWRRLRLFKDLLPWAIQNRPILSHYNDWFTGPPRTILQSAPRPSLL